MSVIDAARRGDLHELAKMLRTLSVDDIMRLDWKQMCCLHHAAHIGHARAVEMIIAATGRVDALGRRGSTPLLLACTAGHTETVHSLIDASACINHANSKGYSCLMAASASGDTAAVQLLLDHKAYLMGIDSTGYTALTSAAKRCQLAALRILLDAKADTSHHTSAIDPLHSAVTSVPANGDTSQMDQIVQLLIAAQANPNHSLHAAAASGHSIAVRQLLQATADLHTTVTTADETVLHAAASAAQPSVLEYLLSVDQSGVLLLRQDACGETALHRACYSPSVGEVDRVPCNVASNFYGTCRSC